MTKAAAEAIAAAMDRLERATAARKVFNDSKFISQARYKGELYHPRPFFCNNTGPIRTPYS